MTASQDKLPAPEGRHRFTISTKLRRDYGIELPVSGATQIVAARGEAGRLDVYSIGSDHHIHHLVRDEGAAAAGEAGSPAAASWNRVRLPWKAVALAAVPQGDGTDKVFFSQFETSGETSCPSPSGVTRLSPSGVTRGEKTASVYELEHAGREPQRRLLGRFTTTDSKVYGLGELAGVRCSDGSNLLVTTLAALPAPDPAAWVVLFGHGGSTGLLSLEEGKGLVAGKATVAFEEGGTTPWPHLTFALVDHGELRLEWGARNGALLQSERLSVPDLPDVVEVRLVRGRGDRLQMIALTGDHRLHVLSQIGGGGRRPPRWARSWQQISPAPPAPSTDAAPDGDVRPSLRHFEVLRQGGGVEIFALDTEDRLWSIPELPEPSRRTGWGGAEDLGVHGAHLAVGATPEGGVEVFAVSRENELFRLRKPPSESRGGPERWPRQRIDWDPPEPEESMLNVYHTGLTILGEDRSAVAGVPVAITATERLPSVVNGLAYEIGPGEPIVAETNAFGRISVIFELADCQPVPSLSFEAGFLDGGQLDVCPRHKVHLYVEDTAHGELAGAAAHRARVHLIPEDTLIEQA